MNDAQTSCGKFIYIELESFFLFFSRCTRVTLIDHSFFFSLSHRRSWMHNLCDWLPWRRKNALLQEDNPHKMFNGMVQKPATKAHLANLPPLQSRPASCSLTTTGWRSIPTDTKKLGGCAASLVIFTSFMGWQYPSRERLFFFRIFKYFFTE